MRALVTILLTLVARALFADADMDSISREHWFEARSAHFNIYSCGELQQVSNLAMRLEQFHDAYGMLAGAQAVSSPPIIVMAFPNQEAMNPFLPVYGGKPASISGFFKRSSDENLIVLAMGTNSWPALQIIFHEYAHLLFRQNEDIWPAWLQEGMADIYSTFEANGRGVRIGLPIPGHLHELTNGDLMPLKELLAVTHDSPQYNESERQGMFYAESWLLTHFLMNGDDPVLKSRFGNFTRLLRQGVPQEEAFTRALGMPLPQIESKLRRYLARNHFEPLGYVVAVNLSAPQHIATRPIGQSETCFRLGNELMRIGRFDDAEAQFNHALQLAPQSPLPREGLGLLAAIRNKPDEALRQLGESLRRGSTSFLANYVYAELRFDEAENGHEHDMQKIAEATATEIRAKLQRTIALMPSFAPAHELLGMLELVQRGDATVAEKQLQIAIQLEPEKQWYRLSLAQAQMMRNDIAAARRTLEPLRQPRVDAKLRAEAEHTLQEIDRYEKESAK